MNYIKHLSSDYDDKEKEEHPTFISIRGARPQRQSRIRIYNTAAGAVLTAEIHVPIIAAAVIITLVLIRVLQSQLASSNMTFPCCIVIFRL